MRTVCHSCESRYEIPDERFSTRSELLVRCPNCRAIMVVGSQPPVFPDEAAATQEDLPAARIRQRIAAQGAGLLESMPTPLEIPIAALRAPGNLDRRKKPRLFEDTTAVDRRRSDRDALASRTAREVTPHSLDPEMGLPVAVEAQPVEEEAPVPLTVVRRPARRRLRDLEAFALGYLTVALVLTWALYAVPHVL